MAGSYKLGAEMRRLVESSLLSFDSGVPPSGEEPILEIDDIQGNILGGFNKDFQSLLAFEIVDPQSVREWLFPFSDLVATAGEVLRWNRVYKFIRSRRGRNAGAIRATWISIAFSSAGLQKILPRINKFVDQAYLVGMAERSLLLGDPRDPDSQGSCANWVVRDPDVLLVIASDDESGLIHVKNLVEDIIKKSMRLLHIDEGRVPPIPNSAHEHFGFRDGISQPGIRGRLSNNPYDFLTSRDNPLNPNEGKPGQRLIWPGEFVFGYPLQDPNDAIRPGAISNAGSAWARNGSFLVFRRYRQDVAAFREFINSSALEIAGRISSLSQLSPAQLAAKLVGRWLSGAPLLRTPELDDPRIADSSCSDNYFNFLQPEAPLPNAQLPQCGKDSFPPAVADPLGLVCPFSAHIRRAYPRDDAGSRSAIETHRILRRGIPFGYPYPAEGERGLLFLAYMSSIERQFEFTIRNWFNNENFRAPGSGCDPLIGQVYGGSRDFVIPYRDPAGSLQKLTIKIPEWTTITGGGYFFAPSISALKQLASGSA